MASPNFRGKILLELPADALNPRRVGRIIDDGHAFAGSAVLHGKTVLRIRPINPRTSEGTMRGTPEAVGRIRVGGAGLNPPCKGMDGQSSANCSGQSTRIILQM
ncbi:MAG: hypothetical protein O6934_05280 [SAR324 cluster bacterium]|nr:hypothetical protein [SAR324 cluster bacterium]